MFGKINRFLAFWGFQMTVFKRHWKGLKWYRQDFQTLRMQKGDDETFAWGEKILMLGERNSEAGNMKGQYFHQDLYVARLIFQANPIKHIDIGSRIDGFVAHVAVFRPIEIIDIRPIKSQVFNISFRQGDLMQLPEDLVNCCDSISCLHAIEHFGLGRYGDTIDYWGYLKAFENITQMLQHGGRFYFSVPIGKQRIEFNAHRVFSVAYLLTLFEAHFTVETFSYIDDHGDFHENVLLQTAQIENNYGCRLGCGIFVLWKNK